MGLNVGETDKVFTLIWLNIKKEKEEKIESSPVRDRHSTTELHH